MSLSLFEKIIAGKEKVSVVGLGYVGMPIAVELAKKVKVIGFDLNIEKIEMYKRGIDPTGEVGNDAVAYSNVEFSADETKLKEAKFHIIAVPTPLNQDKTPNLLPLETATKIVGRNLSKGSIVVFESTVYPGATEEVCLPILEKESGLKCVEDFKIGYSPERINPGDKAHTLKNIKKIVSGIDEKSIVEIKSLYDLVIDAGTHTVSSIKTAEAIKVVENSQRDLNIAFVNEVAMALNTMDIDTNEVIDGMNTKWNALGFRPGLVGGHCIGIAPQYFSYKAEKSGFKCQLISAGRNINEKMGEYVANSAVKQMLAAGKEIENSRVVILGITFKENCPDTRGSKVGDIIDRLREYDICPIVSDPWADEKIAKSEYNVALTDLKDISDADCIIIAVAHEQFKNLTADKFDKMFKKCKNSEKVLIDVKGLFNKKEIDNIGYRYWRL